MTISYEIQIQVNLPLSSHHSSVSRLFFKSSTLPLHFSFLLRFLQVIEFSSFASIIRRKLQQSSSYKAHVNISRVFSCTFIYLFVNIDQSLNNFGAHHNNTLKKINELYCNDNFYNSCPNIARTLWEKRSLINCLDSKSIETS